MHEKTDEELAHEVQTGDKDAFGVLVVRFEPKISRYAKRFFYHQEDVLDVVQEVFLKAYINIQSFDIKRKFSPWIYRIAHNEFINIMKKKKNERISFFDLDVIFPHLVAAETTDREVITQELKHMIDACLDTLDSRYREPILLYYIEEMDYKEIADILHIPVSTVGVRLKRGKASLQRLMAFKDPLITL